MLMINLILILLIGGVVAIFSERLGADVPRKIALAVVIIDLIYLLIALSTIPSWRRYRHPCPAIRKPG